MIKFIDNFLNKITMYRLVLYCLIFFLLAAFLLCSLRILPYSPIALAISTIIITAACLFTNFIFSKIFQAPTNVESSYITALILALIIMPPRLTDYSQFFSIAIWAAVWSIASKYILAIKKKHILNPAAFSVALLAFTINQSASWWIGTAYMAPFVLIGGLLVTKKIRRFDLVLSFFTIASAAIISSSVLRGSTFIAAIEKMLLETPILFFAFIMLTEPITAPPTRIFRIWYGAITGFLFAPWAHVGLIYSTPELSLLLGNIFSYIVSPKEKLVLGLEKKIQAASGVYDFLFASDQNLNFKAGQYLEWTLEHAHPDNRGNRRYFTVASSPTEEKIRIGVKFYPDSSSFKNNLASMNAGDTIIASQLAGEFILPKNIEQKSVFIAGGIGITPYRSMIKYLLDKGEKRPITIFYSNTSPADIAYKDIFDEAEMELGIKTVYTITNAKNDFPDWQGKRGMIDQKMIMEEVPDYKERIFYLSGPHGMVTAFSEMLKKIGVPKWRIKKDFFPGFV